MSQVDDIPESDLLSCFSKREILPDVVWVPWKPREKYQYYFLRSKVPRKYLECPGKNIKLIYFDFFEMQGPQNIIFFKGSAKVPRKLRKLLFRRTLYFKNILKSFADFRGTHTTPERISHFENTTEVRCTFFMWKDDKLVPSWFLVRSQIVSVKGISHETSFAHHL